MAAEGKSKTNSTNNSRNKKRKQRYLPHNKPVKKKGAYPLHPGVQGFFITCDGGKERQASREAINVIDSFYEELVEGNELGGNPKELQNKPLNKKTKFTYSDSSDSDDDNKDESEESDVEEEAQKETKVQKLDAQSNSDSIHKNPSTANPDSPQGDGMPHEVQRKIDSEDNNVHKENDEGSVNGAEKPQAKKQCLEKNQSESGNAGNCKVEEKSIDKLIDAELEELRDKSKRRFSGLDSGCNGVAFVQMRKGDGDPSPKDIVQHMMTSAASTRKHMSRFILRVLPVEITCYASEEDIMRAIKPMISEYFPAEIRTPIKFAVLYDARANTGVERMKIINAVAKSVPAPHKVDLSHPDKTIVVQIVKTVCLIGVVEKYKELAKYNLRQLTSPK